MQICLVHILNHFNIANIFRYEVVSIGSFEN